MIRELVPAALDGQRLDRVVALVADVSRARAAALIAAGAVTVDRAVATSGKVRLADGQTVSIDMAQLPEQRPPEPEPAVEFDVIAADGDIVVVDKPPGLVVHPGAGNDTGTLVNGLLARFPEIADVGDPMRPGIVHRLDAGSSGLLVIARTTGSYEALVGQFARHAAQRRYDAVVWGEPAVRRGVIDAPIGRDPRDPLRMAVVADGREARTGYEVLDSFSSPATTAQVRCELETGRTHQIRVHLSSIGHPLVGDAVYGRGRPALGLDRPFLHATELVFDHPATGQQVAFTSPLPTDLRSWLATAR